MKLSKNMPPGVAGTAAQAAKPRVWYPLLLIFVVLAFGILAGGIVSYQNYERQFRTGIEQLLSAIVELKAAQIVEWRREPLMDANYLRRTPYLTRCALDVLAQPASPTTRQVFTSWLEPLLAGGSYEQVILLDEGLKVGLVYPEGTSGVLGTAARRAAQQALSSRQVVLADLHQEQDGGPIYLSMMVPLVVRRENTGENVPAAGQASSPADRSAGLLVLQINVQKQLYPLIQFWPMQSRTAETLLVRRDGDDALFLNELRSSTNTALIYRIPLTRTNGPAVKAVLGQKGIVEGIDYRGVSVVAALHAIPDSPWSIIARMDTEELYAPIRNRLWLTVLLMVTAFLGTGAIVGLAWRQQHVRFYQERAETAELLLASELRYRRLFEAASDGILILDANNGRVVDVNPFMVEFLGVTREVFLGKKVWELGFFKDIVANEASFIEMQQKGHISCDIALVAYDGGWHEVEFVSNVYLVNRVKVIQCNIHDISERKRAEKHLRGLAERLASMHRTDRAILLAIESPEAIAQSVLMLLPDLVHCTRASVVIFELEEKQARLLATDASGKAAAPMIKDLPIAAFGDLEILRQGRVEIIEEISGVTSPSAAAQVLRAEGIRSSIIVPLVTKQGLIGALHIGWEAAKAITPVEQEIASEMADHIAVAMEQARLRLKSMRRAGELEERVQDRTTQLEAANKELESFSYSVAHDLRAPLRHINGFASLLRTSAGLSLSNKSRHYLEEVTAAATQMGRLIDDLLQFSRTGREEMRQERIELSKLVDDSIHQLQPEINGRHILWQQNPLPAVRADPNLVRQVLINLFSNAIKYTRPRDPARIEIGCASENDHEAVIFVRDNGVGFDMEYSNKLFGVFQRLHADDEFEGTGIGLANVRRIIARHGGRTWAEGKVNQGATFYFSFPTPARRAVPARSTDDN
jgi:PAS domain S-box-containing protein